MKKSEILIDFLTSHEYYLQQIAGMVVIDMSGAVRYINNQCASFFGFKPEDIHEHIIGKQIADIFPYTKMLQNLGPEVVDPQIVFYNSDLGIGISANIPLIVDGVKVGLLEYDLIQEERQFVKLTDDYNAFLKEQLSALRKSINAIEQGKYTVDDIIGDSPVMEALREQIHTVAKSNSTVLITGETGTGKELVAHAIHNLSHRKYKILSKINASAFPENLVESELFGYAKGSFTGANKEGKIGKFEYANGGTLFIDEINHMPKSVQPKLLRTLQEREVEPIGSNKTIPVDVRIVAASSRDILSMVNEGTFRKDLYYRLNVVSIEIPPLREHLEDIEEIVRHQIKILNKELDFSITDIDVDAIELLKQYSWPGNIRELKNVLERAMNFAQGVKLTKDNFSFFINKTSSQLTINSDNPIETAKNKAERDLIVSALEHFKYNKTKTARYLKISRPLLYQKMKRLAISNAPFNE